MHAAGLMRMMETFSDFATELSGFTTRKWTCRQPVIQTGSVDKVTDNVDQTIFTPYFMDRDNIGVSNCAAALASRRNC